MADRTIKPDDTNDLVLQNNDGSAKLELNEDQTVKVTTGSDAGEDFTINTSQLVVEGDTGRIGIGTNAPESFIHTKGSGEVQALFENPSTSASQFAYVEIESNASSSGEAVLRFKTPDGTSYINSKGSATTMTFSSGNVGIGTTNPSNSKFEVHNSGRTFDVYRTTTNNGSTLIAGFSDYGVTKNLVFEVWSGGSVYNDTGVYTTFPSDERLKTEIKETSPKLDKLLQLPIKSYYTTKNSKFKKIGVVAQDLEKIMPSLVDFAEVNETTPMVQRDDDGELLLNDEGKPYVLDKNGDKLSKIKYTKDSLLLFCAIKAIQELSAKVTALENA